MKLMKLAQAIALATPMFLAACAGDDGKNGTNGTAGQNGSQTLVTQTTLSAGDAQCFQGGVRVDSGLDANNDNTLASAEISNTSHLCNQTQLNDSKNFVRIASFPVCTQLDADCNVDTETAAEIVDISKDGNTLIYTDSPAEAIGFVDIKDAAEPAPAGTLAMGGEPTSVVVAGDYALVGVNTSADFINTSGSLAVVDVANKTIVRSLDMGGQPAPVAVSRDTQYAATAR